MMLNLRTQLNFHHFFEFESMNHNRFIIFIIFINLISIHLNSRSWCNCEFEKILGFEYFFFLGKTKKFISFWLLNKSASQFILFIILFILFKLSIVLKNLRTFNVSLSSIHRSDEREKNKIMKSNGFISSSNHLHFLIIDYSNFKITKFLF